MEETFLEQGKKRAIGWVKIQRRRARDISKRFARHKRASIAGAGLRERREKKTTTMIGASLQARTKKNKRIAGRY